MGSGVEGWGVVRKDGEWRHCLFRGFTLFYSKTYAYSVDIINVSNAIFT